MKKKYIGDSASQFVRKKFVRKVVCSEIVCLFENGVFEKIVKLRLFGSS
jgi:hypothetical protein